MKTLFLLFTSLSFLFLADSIELKERNFLGGKVNLKVPVDFKDLSKDEISEAFALSSTPEFVTANEDRSVYLSFSRKGVDADQEKVEKLLPILVRNIGRADGIEIQENSIEKINDRNVAWVNYLQTDSIGTNRHRVFFTDMDGKLLMGSFVYPEAEAKAWDKTAEEILKSLEIK